MEAGTVAGGRATLAHERATYLVYRFGAEALRLLPGQAAWLAGGAGGRLFAALQPAKRAVVRENLRHVVGPEMAAPRLERLVRRAFAAYGHYWTEAARLGSGDREVLGRWTVEGGEHFLSAARSGHGVVVALPHLGVWEAGAVWAASIGFPLTAVAEALSPRELFDWFVAERRALGIEVLALGDRIAGELAAVLRKGGAVALLSDRDLVGDGFEVEFFGEPTRLPGGPAVLALRTGAVLLPGAVYEERGRHHHAVIRPPLPVVREGRLRDDARRITQALAHELEELIRPHPDQWHVFQPNWPPTAHPGRPVGS